MQFVKEFVPDNRYQSGQRPVTVESSRLVWMLWSLTKSIQQWCEKRFRTVEDQETTNNN